MRVAIGILFFCISLVGFGQDLLFPVAKNGKWGLVNSSGKFILTYKYDYIEYFPEANKYTYDFRGLKGIINANGKIDSEPIFENVQLIDSSWVSCKQNGKWNLVFNTEEHFGNQFDSVVCVENDLFLLYKSDTASIYNGSFRKTSKELVRSASVFQKTIIVGQGLDNSYHIYRKENLDLLSKHADTIINISFNYAEIKKGLKSQLVETKEGILVGREMDVNTYQFGNFFYAQEDGAHFLFHGVRDKYFATPELDYVNDVDFPLLTFRKNGRQGVWNLEKGKLLVQPTYENVTSIGGGFLAGDFDRFGIISNSGKVIVPLEYESVDVHDNVYVVQKNGFYGVLSKRGNEIVPTRYTKIGVYDSNIKCYSKKQITIIKLAADGSVKSTKTYDEYMSISIEKERLPRQRSESIRFGSGQKSKPAQGWFRPVLTKTVGDSLVEYRGRWGLKDTADSVVIRPKYPEIERVKSVGITKAYRIKPYSVSATIPAAIINRGWAYNLSKSTLAVYHPPFHLVDDSSRAYITKREFISVRLRDFKNHHLARAFDTKPVLINPEGEIVWKNLTYYGAYAEDILRICQGGETVLTPSRTQHTISKTSSFFENTGAVQHQVGVIEEFIEVNDGEWYYLDKNGRQMNEVPFQFGEEFKHNLAIVKLKGKWGVVDTGMNVIVPIEYERVERIVEGGVSYFQVRNKVSEQYLYNKPNGALSSTEITQVKHYYNGKWFAQKKGEQGWGLIDTNLTPITTFEYDYVFPFENGYATVIKKGKKTVIDENGDEILPFYKSKRVFSLGFDRYAVMSNRGTMVVNVAGDTLLKDTECKTVIESTEEYLVYEMRGRQLNFLNFRSDALLPKSCTILSYSLKDHVFFVLKNGKKRLYSLEKEKYISKDLPRILSIGEGAMIYRGKNGLLGFMNFEGDTLCQPKFKKLENIKNGWAFSRIKTSRGPVNVYGKYLFEESVFRVRPLDENFTFVMMTGTGLIRPNAEVIIPAEYQKIEPYNSSFYKAIKRNNTCDIYTREGKKINDKSYQDIKAISEDAIIVKDKGFDYLYSGFLNKSLSFQNIRPVSKDLYLLDERWLLGMYNHKGEEIIPVRYHKITPVLGHFQVSFFNSFGYYTRDGKALADPRGVDGGGGY